MKTLKLHEHSIHTEDTMETLIEFLWTKISECVDIKDISGKGVAFLMEKVEPYPCTKGDFKSKDGIHIAFPEIVVNKQAFKKIIPGLYRKILEQKLAESLER